MSHYKDVDGERLLCWGRPGTTYTRYEMDFYSYVVSEWFDAIRWAAEGSWRSEYPVEIREVLYERDYGVDRIVNIVRTWSVTCDDNYNIKVEEIEKKCNPATK
jgi:hypothetical protein